MSATVSIKTAHEEKALTVPIQSVTLRRPAEIQDGDKEPETPRPPAAVKKAGAGPGQPMGRQPVEVVFVVEDGRALAREVKTGLSSDTRIEILSGIAAGVSVVSGPFRVLSKELKHQDEVRTDGPRPDQKTSRRRGRPHKH
jgi:HlyD family secretion protein